MPNPSLLRAPYPLSVFCAELPGERIGVEDLPPLPRRLLAHSEDMTATLEAHYQSNLQLEMRDCRDKCRSPSERLVSLRAAKSGTIIELGAIAIFIERLSESARAAVLNAQQPFGRILRESGIARQVQVVAFWRWRSEVWLREQWQLPEAFNGYFYGRQAVLHCPGEPGAALCEVVEILRPQAA